MSHRIKIRLEDAWLSIGAVVGIGFIVAQGTLEPFVPIVYGLFLAIFIVEKIFLGNSLRFAYFTLPSFFLLVYLLSMSVPAISMFSTMTHPSKYTYFVAVQSVLVILPIGVGLANLMEPRASRTIATYFHANISAAPTGLRFKPLCMVLLACSLPILWLYFGYSTHVQLVEVVKAYPTPVDPVRLRFVENELPKVVHYLFEMLRKCILPLCVLYAYFMSHSSRSWKRMFWVLLPSSLLVSALTLDRGPIFGLFAMLALAKILIRRGSILKLINFRFLIILALLMLLLGMVSVLQYQSVFSYKLLFGNAWYVLTYRIFQDAAYMASLSFQTFGYESGFLHGKSIRLLSLLPGYTYYEGFGSTAGYLEAAPVSFVGDLWRNWGWPGVFIGTLCIGFLLQMIQLKVFRSKSAATLSMQVILLVGSAWIIYGNTLGIMTTSVILFGVMFGLLASNHRKAGAIMPEACYEDVPVGLEQ